MSGAVLRTPDECFAGLVDFDYEPRYVEVDGGGLGPLRMHYVDEGPPGAPPVLLLHGQPTWSYLYRHVIARLVERGLRAVALDHVGFGRSDKPAERTEHTVARHVAWVSQAIERMGLRDVTLVAQDWGGPIGFAALAADPGRYARAVAANTVLHTVDPGLEGRLDWANHGIDGGRVVHAEALVDYVLSSQRARRLTPSVFVDVATVTSIGEAALAGYDAPFPSEAHAAAVRQFPVLIPLTRNDPGAAIARRAFTALGEFRRPMLTAYADGDPATRGFDAVFQLQVPGAAGQRHRIMAGAGHFVQEDAGYELGDVVADFVEANPLD